MNSLFSKVRISVLAGALGFSLFSTSCLAVTDVLNTPSIKAELASKSLLLDVVRAGERFVAVGTRGHILYSDDQGASWQQANVPVSVLLTAVSFVGDAQGWAVGHSGVILHTSDGGVSWVKQFDGNQANKMIITQSEQTLMQMKEELKTAPEDEVDDLEYGIEEASFALEDAKLDAEIGASKPLLDVIFRSPDEGFAVGAYGFIFNTKDGGLTWTNYGNRIENVDRFHFNAITQIKGGILLMAGEAGVIFRSEDFGETWEVVESPYEGSYFGLSGTKDEGVALVFGLRGNLFRSEDAGITWTDIDSSTESSLMSASGDENGDISIVGTSGSVLFSNDNGKTFSEKIRESRLGNSSIIYVESNQNKSGKIIIVGEEGVILANPKGVNL